MKKYSFYFLVCGIFICTCKSNDPANTSAVDDAKMIAIMTDVSYLDAHFAELNSHIKDSIVFLKFKEILKKNGISMDEFTKAQTYYNVNEKAHFRLQEAIKKSVHNASLK